jgi:hydrogenase maturation protease
MTKILVAGVGNELFGDDGFGVAVVTELKRRRADQDAAWSRQDLTLLNAGTRGFDLVSALIDGYDAAILIDAAPRGRSPGTLYVIDPALTPGANGELGVLDVASDPHGLHPARALALAKASGAPLSRIFVVGCEPAPQLEMSDELSSAVAAAVEPAIFEIERLVRELSTSEAAHA